MPQKLKTFDSKDLLPDPHGFILPEIAAVMQEEREAEGGRPTADGSRMRGSYALACARQIGFQVLKIEPVLGVPFEILMAFDIGQKFHERLQMIAAQRWHALAEVTASYHPDFDLSCHLDLLYNVGFDGIGDKVVGEIKSTSGFGYMLATGARKSDDGAGPKWEHVTQAALGANAPNIQAQKVHMIYVDKDKHSIAEWMLDMDEPLHHYEDLTLRQLAEAEIERMGGILNRIDNQLLPARHIPGYGRVEVVPEPDSRDDPWNCRYCHWQPICKQLPPGPVPLAQLQEVLDADHQESKS